MHEDTFVGLASGHIYDRVPELARPELLRIVATLSHGEEWVWIGGKERFTAKGLGRIADELDAAGYSVAALVVRRELETAQQACRSRSTPPAIVNEDAVIAKRWDLRY